MTTRGRLAFALTVLFAINLMNFFDRQILGAVGEMVRLDWGLDDTALGTLGTAFTLLYAVVGLPLGWLTDKIRRTWILSAGVLLWTVLTATSGLAKNYWQLFIMRLGVGVGEASCAPASASLIGDLFPASRRGKAMSVFMLGLPIGIGASYLVSGTIAHKFGWRSAFFIAAIPGLICSVAALMVKEPGRGATETHAIGGSRRSGPKNGSQWLLGFLALTAVLYLVFWGRATAWVPPVYFLIGILLLGVLCIIFKRAINAWMEPFLLVLSIPTMWFLILSGALHNFNMYAIGSFLVPFLIRYHMTGMELREATLKASLISVFVNGLAGIPGLVLGGFLGDALMRRRSNGRLLVGATAILISAPLHFVGLTQPRGSALAFAVWMGIGVASMYAYYSTVYSTIQDVIEPALRGSGMALYFFAMYVMGASLGPVGTGLASDLFTRRAATAAGVTEFTRQSLEPFRAEGLHSAMLFIPILGALLTLVLFVGAMTVTRDMERLQRWMKQQASKSETAEEAVVAQGAATQGD
jgi:MFS family permease